MDEHATCYGGKPRPRRLCVGWGPRFPSQKGRSPPNFWPHVFILAKRLDDQDGMEVGLSPGDFVLDGDTVPFPQKGAEPPPQFLVYFCCGQMAGCINMPLGMEVGLSPGDFV